MYLGNYIKIQGKEGLATRQVKRIGRKRKKRKEGTSKNIKKKKG